MSQARYSERVTATLPKAVKEELRERAALLGISMSDLLRRITRIPDAERSSG